MSNTTRQRLGVEARRAQLLEVASELFAGRPYDEVWVEHVAERAGVSRGLLYHYFGSKRGLLHAVIELETQRIYAATAPDAALPAADRLRASLAGYVDYVVAHPHGYRAMFRSAVSADPRVRELVDANLLRQRDRLLAGLGDTASDAQRLAVHGWIASLIAMVLEWLDEPALTRDELIDLAVATFRATVRAAA